jgi:SAM-dependent methyltransferase
MTMNLDLLRRFFKETPFQPATSLWRAVEIDVVLSRPFPLGRGMDLGCGDGKLMKTIIDHVGRRELVGVDIDPLETGQASALGIYDTIHTTSGSRIPEPEKSFDFVFSNSVLEHIDTIEDVLDEVARVLKPGGKFVFTVPSEYFHACLRGPWLSTTSRSEYLEEIDRRCAHKRYWSIDLWEQELGRRGLMVSDRVEYLTAKEARRWENISRLTAGILYLVFRRRRQPIEIQRRLGLRKSMSSFPNALAGVASRTLAVGLNGGSQSTGPFGCVLVESIKGS